MSFLFQFKLIYLVLNIVQEYFFYLTKIFPLTLFHNILPYFASFHFWSIMSAMTAFADPFLTF